MNAIVVPPQQDLERCPLARERTSDEIAVSLRQRLIRHANYRIF